MAKIIFSIRGLALFFPRKGLVRGHSLIRKMLAFDSWKSLLQAIQRILAIALLFLAPF